MLCGHMWKVEKEWKTGGGSWFGGVRRTGTGDSVVSTEDFWL